MRKRLPRRLSQDGEPAGGVFPQEGIGRKPNDDETRFTGCLCRVGARGRSEPQPRRQPRGLRRGRRRLRRAARRGLLVRNALPYRTHALAVTLLLLASAARAGTLVISADQAEGGAQVKASYGIPSGLSTAPVRFRVTSSNTAAATVPNEISVQPGSKVFFNIQTGSVAANTSVTVEVSPFFATARQQEPPATDSLVVLAPPQVASVSVAPTSVGAGQSATGTVSISRAAAAGGVRVALASGNTNAATVPAHVTVPSGANSATFTVSTLSGVSQNTNATIT